MSITANDPSAAETTSPAPANPGQFTVTRTGDTSADLTVFYSVSGTATNGTDYSTLSGSATILAGQSSATIDVMPLNDYLTEGDAVVLTLTSDAAYTLADPTSATVRIADNPYPSSSWSAAGPRSGCWTPTRGA